MTNQTISPNWCEDKCEDLSLINQLIVSRGIEHIPVRIFILQGSGEDVNLVVEKEKELFPNSVIFNKIEESSACLYFVSEDFAKNCSSDDLKNALYLDIHSIGKENLVKKLINELNIPEAENVISCLNNNTLNDLLEKDFNKILMKILLNYTKRTKGSAAFTLPLDNSDVSFLEPQIKETPVVEETPTVKENPKAEETSTAEETPRVQETPVAKSHDSKKTILSDALKFKGHKKIDEKPLFANETEEECEQETKVPKPKVTKTVKTAFKESLTPEEDANNKRLLEDIRNRYKTTISVIEDTKDSRFLSLKKEIKEALSTDSYKKQWCPVYLSITDDISTPLYSNLYQLDQETLAFNKKVVRQGVHLVCGLCGHEWDEDVTFKEKGVIYAECPECFSQRPFDKE